MSLVSLTLSEKTRLFEGLKRIDTLEKKVADIEKLIEMPIRFEDSVDEAPENAEPVKLDDEDN